MTFLPNPPCLPDAFGNGGPETVGLKGLPIPGQLSERLERMIAVQMSAYPDTWSDEDRREMAEHHLFDQHQAA